MNKRYEVVDLNTFFKNCELNWDQKENIIAALEFCIRDLNASEGNRVIRSIVKVSRILMNCLTMSWYSQRLNYIKPIYI